MSDQITDRRAKLEKIRALGVDPYGARFTDITANADIRAAAEKLPLEAGQIRAEADAHFRAAGRLVLYRDIGSLIFMTVRDRTGELQFGLSKKMLVQGTEARRHEGTEARSHQNQEQRRCDRKQLGVASPRRRARPSSPNLKRCARP